MRSSSVWLNLALAALAVAVSVGALEVGLRLTTPFARNVWPAHFDPDVGFVFDPGSEVRWTDGSQFWTRTRVNTQGMLDRPPRGPKPPGVCRILFVGDSFVEAAQVPIADKVQVVIERLAAERPGFPPVEAAAVGYSGTGQANQLPLYEHLGRAFHPDVVVLVVVANDFRDNSAVLTGLANGWDPRHAPRTFFVPNEQGDGFVRQAIDPAWRAKSMPTPAPGALVRLGDALARSSFLFAFARMRLERVWPPSSAAENARAAWLSRLDGFGGVLDGWDRTAQPDPDEVFFQPGPLPPAFEQAVGATRAAFAEFSRLGHEDGFRLLAFGTHSLRAPSPQVERLRAILDPLGIPYVDQSDYVRAAGGRVEDAYFRHDGHWNAEGHRSAAEAVLAHLAADPAWCGRHRP